MIKNKTLVIDGYGDLDKFEKDIFDVLFEIYLETKVTIPFPKTVYLGGAIECTEEEIFLEDYFRVHFLTLIFLGILGKLEKGTLEMYFKHLKKVLKNKTL